jgi:hypothetical protein
MSQSNGGISQLASIAMMPMQNAATGACGLWAFDPLFGFNDPVNPSVHSFKVEEVAHGRTPTISRLIVTYRDLGVLKITFTLTGSNDAGEIVSATTGEVTLGNANPTNKLLTKILAPTLTAQNLQLAMFRAANAGPLSITKITLAGRVEMQKYA